MSASSSSAAPVPVGPRALDPALPTGAQDGSARASDAQAQSSSSAIVPGKTDAAAPQPDLAQVLTAEALDRIVKYISGEIQASAEDFTLLEELNRCAEARYADMGSRAAALGALVAGIRGRVGALGPQLQQVDALYAGVLQLEQVVKNLDLYTADLEKQFKLAYQS